MKRSNVIRAPVGYNNNNTIKKNAKRYQKEATGKKNE